MRILRVLLIFAALILAIAPLLMLIDLTAGGTGYGLCQEGWTGCDGSFTAGLRRMAWLCGGLFVLAGGVRMISLWIRRLERQRQLEQFYTSQDSGG